MKRAQVSQVFTYIVAILIIGLLVVFGFKGIGWILNTQCANQRLVFEKDLLEFIDEYSEYGSVHEENIKVPCNIREVCFVNLSFCASEGAVPGLYLNSGDPVIEDATFQCTANIFIKGKFTETLSSPAKFSNKINLNTGPLQCFEVKGGKLDLVFSGLGRTTLIEAG